MTTVVLQNIDGRLRTETDDTPSSACTVEMALDDDDDYDEHLNYPGFNANMTERTYQHELLSPF